MLRVKDMQMDSFGHATFVVGSTAISLAGILSYIGVTKVVGVYMSIEGGDIRWKADGTAPTLTQGHLLYDTEDCEAYDPNMVFINKLQLIRAGSADVTIQMSMY